MSEVGENPSVQEEDLHPVPERDDSLEFDLEEADRGLLRRGFPAALTRRRRWRQVVPRSAPALAGWSVVMACSLVVLLLSDDQDIDVDFDPSLRQWVALAVLVLLPVLAAAAAYAVSLIRTVRGRWAASLMAIAVGVTSDWWGDEGTRVATDTAIDIAVVALILLLTGMGVGAVVAWCLRQTVRHLRSAAHLMVRSLPVVLLTVLAFFNTAVWVVATDLDTARIAVLVVFLSAIAVAFLVIGVKEGIETMASRDHEATESHDFLADLPFADTAPARAARPLRPSERINLLVLAVTSYVVQLALIATITGGVFFVLGVIVLNPDVLARLTNGMTRPAELFDFSLPFSQAHVHVTAILTALTFMYIGVKAVGDGEYRREFLNPLITHLRYTLEARHRYVALIGEVDSAPSSLRDGSPSGNG